MEMRSVLGVVGVVAAFMAASLASWSLFVALRRDVTRGSSTQDRGGSSSRGRSSSRERSSSRGGSLKNVVAITLRNGVPALHGASLALLRIRPVATFAGDSHRRCESMGVVCSQESLVSLALAFFVVCAVFGSLVTRTVFGGLVLDALLAAILVVRLQTWKEQERESLRNEVPHALSVMGDCFQSGYSLVQSMRHVSDQTQGRMSEAFGRCADELELGETPREALANIRGIEGVEELSFVAVALDVQHQSGGSFSSVLSNAQRMVADEIDLRRSLHVQTAQARLSAQVVSLMPFILMALLSLMSEGFLDSFFGSLAGMALLAVAVIMEAAGIMLVRKMLKVAQ